MFVYKRFATSLIGAFIAATPVAAQTAELSTAELSTTGPSSVPASADAAPVLPPAAGPLALPVADLQPAPPEGMAATFPVPSHDAVGYVTPNRDLSPEEMVWHLRAALNVAALGCRGATEAQTAAAYNALLTKAKAELAATSEAVAARYRVKFGDAWQQRNDDAMTRLYNFFAQPSAHRDFCKAANAVLHEAEAIDPAALPVFAAAALPRLESPFLIAFAEYDLYRMKLAGWRLRHAPTIVIASAASPQMGPRPELQPGPQHIGPQP